MHVSRSWQASQFVNTQLAVQLLKNDDGMAGVVVVCFVS